MGEIEKFQERESERISSVNDYSWKDKEREGKKEERKRGVQSQI